MPRPLPGTRAADPYRASHGGPGLCPRFRAVPRPPPPGGTAVAAGRCPGRSFR